MQQYRQIEFTGQLQLLDEEEFLTPRVDVGHVAIEADLADIAGHWPQDLPAGVIHADLFPDNVFFLDAPGGRPVVSGLIDFYFACNDMYAYDLGIMLNSWCFEVDGSYNITKGKALLSAYRAVRPVSEAEARALPVLMRGSALRFLLRQEVARGRMNAADPAHPEAGSGLIVLAMGKMGAGELNYSSDIDLIVLYDAMTPLLGDPHEAATFFVRFTSTCPTAPFTASGSLRRAAMFAAVARRFGSGLRHATATNSRKRRRSAASGTERSGRTAAT